MLNIVAKHAWGLDVAECFTEHKLGKTGITSVISWLLNG